MPRPSSGPTDSDGFFTDGSDDVDPDFLEALDNNEHLRSPDKPKTNEPGTSQFVPSSQESSSSTLIGTPSKPPIVRATTPSVKLYHSIKETMASVKLPKTPGRTSPDPIRKKLFLDTSRKSDVHKREDTAKPVLVKERPKKIIIIESSDEDASEADREEVSALLTDTDMSLFDPRSPTTSMSSVDFLPSTTRPNRSIPPLGSFPSTSSPRKKRDASSSNPAIGSPSKYRKMDEQVSHTRTSSHQARSKGSTRPIKISPPVPAVNPGDIFSTPAGPPTNSSLYTRPRNEEHRNMRAVGVDVGDNGQDSSAARPSEPLSVDRNPTPIRSTTIPKLPSTYVNPFDDDLFRPQTTPQKSPPRTKQAHVDLLRSPLPETKDYVAEFLKGKIGVDLKHSIIAYDKRVQTLLDEAEISWGVQYELARGVTLGLWDWDQVPSKISKLKGKDVAVAYKVRNIILDRPLQGKPDLALWEEYDREQLAILENHERGLGLQGEWHGVQDWYGGQIQQIAHLMKGDDGYFIQLDMPEKRRSHRLARYLGSRRILQLGVPDELMLKEQQSIVEYLSHKFILCGRVYIPLHAKDNSLYMVETDEQWDGRRPELWCGDQYRKSFADIIAWHNPLDLNRKQAISKWSTRFALALSNSYPVLLFEDENIFVIDDIYALDWSKVGKAPAEKIMTDGCGLINAAAARMVAQKLGRSIRMTAIQGRVFSGKGLWIIHPTNDDPEPKIWIRKSQSKIVYTYPLARSHRILDLLSVSEPPTSTNLTRQSIVNLAHNGVPHDVLVKMMVEGLTDEVKPLMEWDGPNAMLALWSTVNKLGNVSGTRLQRSAAGLSRALGLTGRDWGHDNVEITDKATALKEALEEMETPTYTGRSEYSGLPSSMHENALEMIQSGFRPDKAPFLRGKLRYITSEKIKSTIEKYQIPLPQSLTAFVVPDPLGVLEEGQIYYRCSQAMIDPDTQTAFNVVTGDVLVGRYPVRLPSDIQKMKAVDIPELLHYSDVIIVSTKGNFSPASLLSGGDYDGDELFIIREAALVEPFKNKPLTEMPENLQKDNFEGQVESVDAFAQRAMSLSALEAQTAFQRILLLGLHDSQVGLYSTFHDYAVFKHGYADHRAICMAYMFNILLDSSKTGLRLKPGILNRDKSKFGHKIPNLPGPGSSPTILNTLFLAGTNAGDELLSQYDNISGAKTYTAPDPDLRAPFDLASDHAQKVAQEFNLKVFSEELDLIKKHVEAAHTAFIEACSKPNNPSPQKKKPKKTRQKKDLMLHAAQLYARDIPGILLIRNVEEVKASYAYHLSSGNFAFTVAFQEICDIKAHADPGGIAPSTRSFDEAKAMTSQFQRFLKRANGDKL